MFGMSVQEVDGDREEVPVESGKSRQEPDFRHLKATNAIPATDILMMAQHPANRNSAIARNINGMMTQWCLLEGLPQQAYRVHADCNTHAENIASTFNPAARNTPKSSERPKASSRYP
ncbi:hypothetical protein SKAU_G00254580 [Synaphobranchus kaupii]|uniref:Uncharacterized protein n=1 Tax=Synaphobranchus kaupii TaxID=118154 RepID=A0A9Q1F3J1_SYNKA|nr:hypothetical protein SKAU_G00254580 [Synaphobranchus kaupii]